MTLPPLPLGSLKWTPELQASSLPTFTFTARVVIHEQREWELHNSKTMWMGRSVFSTLSPPPPPTTFTKQNKLLHFPPSHLQQESLIMNITFTTRVMTHEHHTYSKSCDSWAASTTQRQGEWRIPLPTTTTFTKQKLIKCTTSFQQMLCFKEQEAK